MAAFSLVVKDIAPYEIHGGNPAKLIRIRFPPEIVELLLDLRWWDLPTNKIRKIKHHLSTQPTTELLKELIEG